MKKGWLLILLVFTSASGFAQKCNYLEEKDGETGIVMQKLMVNIKKDFLVYFSKGGGKRYMSFDITFTEIRKDLIRQGDTMALQLSNDDFIFLRARKEATPVGKANDVFEMTTYFPEYELSSADFDRLLAARITGIKMNFGKTFSVWEFEDRDGKKMLEGAKCIK